MENSEGNQNGTITHFRKLMARIFCWGWCLDKRGNQNEEYPSASFSQNTRWQDEFREYGFESAQEESESDSDEVEYSPLTIPEMFEKILSYVDTGSLLSCRLLSRRWCRISSVILHQRPETEMEFHFTRYHGFTKQPEKSKEQDENRLYKFVQCFQRSKNWPFYRFSFIDNTQILPSAQSVFENLDWNFFLSHFDMSKIKCLKIRFCACCHYDGSLEILLDAVRHLLLHRIPRLEEFSLFVAYGAGPPETKLFPPLPTTEIDPIRLPNLKVIHFEDPIFKNYPEICKDLLNAGVNLKRIILHNCQFYELGFFPETFELLSSLGKIHLVTQQQLQKLTSPKKTYLSLEAERGQLE